MNYRNPAKTVVDPRWNAETRLIDARASIMDELTRGLAIANNLARYDEGPDSYAKRLKAIQDLHQYLVKHVNL